MDPSRIRNFSIIAHIDHGKSTLADRLLLDTGAISPREFRDQILDDMELERERGITIKARAVRILYNGYTLNLIDTPGHIDFTYEVSKSLAACEGALLLVDASQGVQAQTVTNLYLARKQGLTVIPVLSKCDLPHADLERAAHELTTLCEAPASQVLFTSAKAGKGTAEVLHSIVERIPAPTGSSRAPLRALIFDSIFDVYKGVIVYVRVVDGAVKIGDCVRLMRAGHAYTVEELGIFNPRPKRMDTLGAGEVGYIVANIKNVADVKVGDTVTLDGARAAQPLPGYQDPQPMVFCGLYPVAAKDFTVLREAFAKLRLNDASFVYEPENSGALGMGFRAGFLGLLHLEIIHARLEREFDLELLVTAPNVVLQITRTNGTVVIVDNPTNLPSPNEIAKIEEPFIRAHLLIPAQHIGIVMQLCQERRGQYISTEYLESSRVLLIYELPFAEVVLDFYDKVKSLTSGYGSFHYEFVGYREADLAKLDILLNGERVDALSLIVVREQAYRKGRAIVEKLKEAIPRQLFEVAIQAAIGSKVIARETIKALKKDVTSKCYGGDITRKRKLWEKQKAGKKRMKQIGKVELPQEAFLSVLRIDQ